MILDNEELKARESSIDNLVNRLRLRTAGSNQDIDMIDDQDFSAFLSRSVITSPSGQLLPGQLPKKTNEIPAVPGLPDSNPSASELPTLDDLVTDSATKIRLGIIQGSALDVLASTLEQLKANMYDVDSPKTLSKIATDMSKIVTGIRTSENKETGPVNQQVIIYKPIVNNEAHYETVKVNE
jgi:hypothetical protein